MENKKLIKRLLKSYDESSPFVTEVAMSESSIKDYYDFFRADDGNTVQKMSFEEYKDEGYYFFEIHSYNNEEGERIDESAGMLKIGNTTKDLDNGFKNEPGYKHYINEKLFEKFKNNFFELCETAKEEQAGRENGYSIITLEQDGTLGEYFFHSNNSEHLDPNYIILCRINCWNILDDESYNETNPKGETKEGHLWDNQQNQWEEIEEAKEYIIDEACGRYQGQDIVFAEEMNTAMENINLEEN